MIIKYGHLWTIQCSERNEKGRTAFVYYYRYNSERITVIQGEILNSEDDYKSMIELNEKMKNVRKKFGKIILK